MKFRLNIGAGNQRGFSLFETMVVCAISAILGLVASLSLSKISLSFNRVNARSYLLTDLKRAQAESITQGCRGIVNIAADGKSYSFGCDYLSYDPSATPTHDVVSFVRYLPAQITISASGPIIMNSRGQSVDTAGIITSLTISLSETDSGTPEVFSTGTLLGTGVFSYGS